MSRLKTLFAVGLLSLVLPVAAFAQQATSYDPCTIYPKQSALHHFTSATDSLLVASPSSSVQIYVCGVQVSQALGTETVVLNSATVNTTGTCSGTAVNLSPIWIPPLATQGQVVNYPSVPLTAAIVPAGLHLCATSTGTAAQDVWVQYVIH
jgi:hypothetical protein